MYTCTSICHVQYNQKDNNTSWKATTNLKKFKTDLKKKIVRYHTYFRS